MSASGGKADIEAKLTTCDGGAAHRGEYREAAEAIEAVADESDG
jgi:hypothetical protein